MSPLNRRTFIAGSAALASAPALGAVAASGETDVAIVGAGAAGIAAARKVAAAGRRFALIEAGDHDRRALHHREPHVRRALRSRRALDPHAGHQSGGEARARAGLDIYPAPPGQKLRIGKRNAREGEMEDYLAAIVRAKPRDPGGGARQGRRRLRARRCRRISAIGGRRSNSCSGRSAAARTLDEISAVDFARSLERDVDAFCRQGFGALLAKLGADLPVQLERR